MFFVYLDDFGHSGPYFDRGHARHNANPVFGFAGFALPDDQVRPFSSFFLQLKQHVLSHDLMKCGKPVYRWEKKGTSLFTKTSIVKYSAVREAGFRLLNEVRLRGGFVFYYGREKMRSRDDLRSVGLQTTVLSHAIRRLDTVFLRHRSRFSIVMDESSSRIEYLEAAQKTMFGNSACRQLVSPPFEVESHLDQNTQAADWIAALIGKLYAYKFHPESFSDYEPFERYFWSRLHSVAHDSTVEKHSEIKSSIRKTPSVIAKITETIVTTTIEIGPSEKT